jgi:hypothetical protein
MFFEWSNQSWEAFAKVRGIMVPERIGDDSYTDKLTAEFLDIEIEFRPITTRE